MSRSASMVVTTDQARAAIRTFGQLQAQTEALEQKLTEWNDLESRVLTNLANVPNIVKLNVGGTTFETAKETLLRVKGSYFEALLGSGRWNPDSIGGAYFLDLDPVIFRRVLLFLRTGDVSTEGLVAVERKEFASMMEYLKLTQCPTPADLCQWDPDKSMGPGLEFSRKLRSVEGTHKHGGCTVIAKEALMGRLQVRVEQAVGPFSVSLGPLMNGCALLKHQCYKYFSSGCVQSMHDSSQQVAPKIKRDDVVTIHRKQATVEFAVNDEAPTIVELDDPSLDLFPCVSFQRGKMTILH